KCGVETIITIGGFRMESENKPKVIAAATNEKLLQQALGAKALVSSVGNPIVGTAGLILGLGRFKKTDALCLLGETRGYLPDPRAAKSVLEVLQAMLGITVDLSKLDEEIAKAEKMVSRLRKIEERRASQAEEIKKEEDKKVTYIS
ncbi:PAC2 family protein, partial [Candidatus Bathyarchaeota archaeon]|nr:PAC2 family protein [Candidatus Bathyarchaeota archaeon]